MDNIYEEAYQCLLEEGYGDNDAIEIVNYLYDNNSLDGMLYESKAKLAKGVIDMVRMLGGMSGVWKPSAAAMRKAPGIQGAISRAVQGGGSKAAATTSKTVSKVRGAAKDPWKQFPKKTQPSQLAPGAYPSSPVKGRLLPPAKPIPTPKETGSMLGVRNVPNIKQVSKKYGMDVPAPKPAWGGKPKDPWTTSSGLVNVPKAPKGPSAETVKKVQAALQPAKELKALPAGKKGGSLTPSPSGALSRPKGGALAVDDTVKVNVRNLGAPPKSGGPTRYQGTRSGGQLSGGSTKALPAAGQTSSRRSAAAATAAAAAAGTAGTGVRTGTTSAIVKRQQPLADKVKGAMSSKGARRVAGGAALLGLTGYGLSKLDGGRKAGVTKPEGGVLADREEPKAPAAPKQKSAPKVTLAPKTPAEPKATTTPAKPAAPAKKKMTKIDRDVEELMQMRAASMDRQGRKDDAAKLRAEIEKKYAGYER